MSILNQDSFQSLSNYFTTDAWQLIESFLFNFQKKMSSLDINSDDQTKVITGIVEYIEEFVENFVDKSKITFDDAIGLLKDIGSPSEILQAMDVSFDQVVHSEVISRSEIDKSNVCAFCNWPNDSDARFCDNCGRNLSGSIRKSEEFFPLELIEYSYIAIFCLSYLVSLILGIALINIQFSTFAEPDLIKIPNLFNRLHGVASGMLIPALILGLVIGFSIKRFYHKKVRKNYRYEIQLVQYRKYFSLGLVLSLIAVWLFFIYSPLDVSRDEFATMSILLLILSLISFFFLYRWNIIQVPSDVPYFVLLRFISSYEIEIMKKLRSGNLLGGLILLIGVYGLWGELMFWTVFGLPAWIAVYLSLLLLLNSFYLLYYFSWNQTVKNFTK